MKHWEQKLMKAASPFLDDRHEPPFQEYLELATPYIPFYLGGEGKLSVGRAIKFAQQGAAMVVNCAPFGCCPKPCDGHHRAALGGRGHAHRQPVLRRQRRTEPPPRSLSQQRGSRRRGMPGFLRRSQRATLDGCRSRPTGAAKNLLSRVREGSGGAA